MPRKVPPTREGWYALHDFRTIDWDAWRDAPERTRDAALADGVEFLSAHEDVTDAEDGSSAVFSVMGHEADLLILHFRPTVNALDTAERAFERTEFADFTERTDSYMSVTEVGSYTSDEMVKDPEDIEDTGMARYVASKLYPDVPDAEFLCFYPMSKLRLPEANWYDTPYDERADMMASHGEIGKTYAGKVTQIITGSIGMEDYEWGVDLFSNDPTHIKDILYEMRFDEASSRFAEFGEFSFGRRFPPEDLPAFMAGEEIPTPEDAHPHGESHHGSGHAHGESDHGETSEADSPHGTGEAEAEGIRGELEDLDIYAGQPHGEDVYSIVLYSEADADELFEEVTGLRESFDHYDTHVKTAVYEGDERAAVVSIWDTQSAAETAGGFLSDLPGIVARAGEESGFGTMGMFYTVKPEHREDFVEKFGAVGDALADMEGHFDSELLANHEDENDMFISSQWRSKDDAMDFFRSDAFRDTVSWGRDILADRPRHVFLA
ncbi:MULTISPECIES: heme-binding protein [unclassified Haladaptatus]|uniref:heme-binding protein n=1 Tax=unclassified Haladaptatus TaxID=2622732 RepID=UPI00209C281F|nr:MULTISPECIES: heme-binding protein [unclassified Haladaptatus]MCO8242950.1 heme-binding protein [Haladaptatus sp. AB643]MCO8252706.1 heme-binding protein [Haladaptatus sp. AB618]